MPATIQRKTAKLGAFKKLSFALVANMLLDLEGGESVSSVARRYGVSRPGVNYWKPYIGLSERWLRVVRAMERENLFLVARIDRSKERLNVAKKLIKQLEPRPKRRSLYAASLQAGFSLSREEANKLCGIGHSAGHTSASQSGDHRLVSLMRKYLQENPGAGFNQMFKVLLSDQRCTRNHAETLYREARLQRRWRKKPVEIPRRVSFRILPDFKRDEVWSIDFLIDSLPSGKRYSVFSAIDEFSRECVVCRVMPQATSKAVLGALDELRQRSRVPGLLRSDRGAQFTSHAYRHWTRVNRIRTSYSRPSTPTDNAYVERFNLTIREEVLNWYRFRSLAEVQRMLDDWRTRYNMARPHRALHGLSPLQFVELYGGQFEASDLSTNTNIRPSIRKSHRSLI